MAENKKIVVVNLQKLEVAPIGAWGDVGAGGVVGQGG